MAKTLIRPSMKTFDAQNQICPKPLIMAKKALKECQQDEVFELLINNETSKENVERFLSENKISFITKQADELYQLIITSGNSELLNEDAEAFCPITKTSSNTGDLIIINKDQIGHGPKDLSQKLVEGFFSTIEESGATPYGIVFYNSGVFLAMNDSPVLSNLKQIEKNGTKILVCGTCVDHYELKSNVGIGTISNMYDILGMMQKATKVFTP